MAVESAENALDWAGYEEPDDTFHRTIASATDTPLLVALNYQLNALWRAIARTSVTRETERSASSHASFAEHLAIADAIAQHDRSQAHYAMRKHIALVSARLFGEI